MGSVVVTEENTASTAEMTEVMLAPRACPVSLPARAPKVPINVAEYREFQDGELIAGTRYQVIRLIGVGGMGTVYEVEHVELGKRFVLKALLRELSRREDLVIRLRNEWRALGRLEHPNIVTVTDAGSSATGVPFYVMERLEGETLAQRMRRTRRFPVSEAVAIAAGVLEGLAAAHQINVVHRDVKPPNIFLLGDGRPKVLDFGVAKIVDDPGVVTARGIAVGTPRYMSPEQARGESVDGRADVYSTGLILFEMIAGVSPFDDARDANELILAHLVRRPPSLATLAMGVPPELDAAVGRMLAKGRDERPATALEAARILRGLAPALANLAKAESRSSPPPSAAPTDVTLVPTEAPHDTTRPDGLASRRPPPTLGSESSASLAGRSEPAPAAPGRVRSADSTQPRLRTAWATAGADTLIAPPSFAPTASPRGDARIRTEVLTAVPIPDAAVTRTRFPAASVSETPPPVTPTPGPDANGAEKPRSARAWIALSAAFTLVAIGAGVVLWPFVAPGSRAGVARPASTQGAAAAAQAPPGETPALVQQLAAAVPPTHDQASLPPVPTAERRDRSAPARAHRAGAPTASSGALQTSERIAAPPASGTARSASAAAPVAPLPAVPPAPKRPSADVLPSSGL
jgi:serine/threonine-protein kinase